MSLGISDSISVVETIGHNIPLSPADFFQVILQHNLSSEEQEQASPQISMSFSDGRIFTV
jgi:hypothetical protein